jgi:hypothetical protein
MLRQRSAIDVLRVEEVGICTQEYLDFLFHRG